MGKKEKLIREYFSLRHQFDINEGENCLAIFPEIPTPNDIYEWSRSFKVIDLEDKIASVNRAISEQEKKLQTKAYFSTEEGSKLKKHLENKLEEVYNKIDDLKNQYHDKLNDLIVSNLGDKFTTIFDGCSNRCSMEIGLKNTDPERDNFVFEFGHRFEIDYSKKWFCNSNYEMNINYGTLGSFNGMTDENRIAYISGFGKFVSNVELKNTMINLFKEFMSKSSVLIKETEEINNRLSDPLNYNK